MAMDVAEADAMVAAAERSERILMVAHCWRFHPDVIALRDRIAAGELGEVVKTRGYGVHAKWGPAGWFVDPALAGGGALADMGVHAIDTARFLLGGPEPARVRRGDRHPLQRATRSTTTRSFSSRGRTARTRSSSRAGGSPHLGGLEAETEVYGTGGYARIFGFTEPPTPDYEHCPQSMYTAQMAEFCDALREGRPPTPTGADGARRDAGRRGGLPLGGLLGARMTLVLGIDGGGTKTHAVIADADGTVRGFATSGPANWEVVGLRGAGESLREATRRALAGGRRRVGRPRRRRRSASRASTGTPTCPG